MNNYNSENSINSGSSITSSTSNNSTTHPYKCVICMKHHKKARKICICRESVLCKNCFKIANQRQLKRCPVCRRDLSIYTKDDEYHNLLLYQKFFFWLSIYLGIEIIMPYLIFKNRYFDKNKETYKNYVSQSVWNASYDYGYFMLSLIINSLVIKPCIIIFFNWLELNRIELELLNTNLSRKYLIVNYVIQLCIQMYMSIDYDKEHIKNYYYTLNISITLLLFIAILFLISLIGLHKFYIKNVTSKLKSQFHIRYKSLKIVPIFSNLNGENDENRENDENIINDDNDIIVEDIEYMENMENINIIRIIRNDMLQNMMVKERGIESSNTIENINNNTDIELSTRPSTRPSTRKKRRLPFRPHKISPSNSNNLTNNNIIEHLNLESGSEESFLSITNIKPNINPTNDIEIGQNMVNEETNLNRGNSRVSHV